MRYAQAEVGVGPVTVTYVRLFLDIIILLFLIVLSSALADRPHQKKKKKKKKKNLLFFFLNAHATTRGAPGWSFKRSFGVTAFFFFKKKIIKN